MRISKLVLSALFTLGACEREPAESTPPRDGLPFDPGCAYNFLVEGHPAGCVQETALCLDALLPVPCTSAESACIDGFNKCIEAGAECMKSTQP